MTSMIKQFATAARDHGLHPLPCNADKAPAISRKETEDRPQALEEIERWTSPMVALVCGNEVNPVLAIDFDQAGLFYDAYNARVQSERPELWGRLTVERSMNGGYHIWIRTKRPYMTQKLAHNVIEVEGPGEFPSCGKDYKAFEYRGKWVINPDAIETRGATKGLGAYCVCSPSPGYELMQGKILSMPLLDDEEVDFLLSVAREFETYFPEPKRPKVKPEARPAEGDRPGDDFNARGEILPILEKHGWSVSKEVGDRIHLARPGKTGCTSATLTADRVFYPFSSNSHPFEPNEAYAPFSVYAMLEHGGDFAAAAKDLAAQGYGAGESDWNPNGGQRAGKTNSSYNSYNSSNDLENWTPTERAWPKLQRAAMPGIIGEFVDVATENSEADPAAILATVLVRLGVEAGSPDPTTRPHVYVGETRHESRLFAVVTGRSSKARKGTSAQPVQRLFAVKGTMGAPSMGGVSFGPLSTGEGIIYAVRDAIQDWKEKEQVFVTIDPGVTDKRLYVQEEELAAALSAGKRDGNTLSATLRALWDSGTRSPMTKTSKTRCTDAHVGILAHITLDELALTLSDCDKLNGYANRFLWVLARRAKRVSRPTRIPENVFSPIQSTVWQRLNYAHKMGEMSISSEFWDVFDAEYDRLSEDRPGMAGAITARAEAQIIRLSMIYAIAAGTRTIGADHIQSALAFWNYAQASAEYIFADQTGGGKLDATIKSLIEGAQCGLSMTELHEKTGRNHKAHELKSSVQRLVDAGIVVSRTVRGPDDRKSRTVFFKNIPTNNTNYTNYSEPPTAPGYGEQIPDEVVI